MREDQVQNAVKFLSHPRVQGSPVIHRRSFLENKGLTKEEIDEAFQRVPDPAPATNGETASSNQAPMPSSSTGIQPSQQPAVVPASAAIRTLAAARSRLRWYHLLLSAGFVVSLGAGSALFWKRVALPKIKSWIRKVAAEGSEGENEKANLKLSEEVVEAAKCASTTAEELIKTREQLLAAKEEDKKVLESFMQGISVQMRSIGESIRNLESRGDMLRNARHPSLDSVPSVQQKTSMQPWDAPQYAKQRTPTYGLSSQNNDGSYSEETQANYDLSSYPNGSPRDPSDTWKNTEDRPAAKPWIPPQPPGIVNPEAAAAIHQQKKSSGDVGGYSSFAKASNGNAAAEINGGATGTASFNEIEEEQTIAVE